MYNRITVSQRSQLEAGRWVELEAWGGVSSLAPLFNILRRDDMPTLWDRTAALAPLVQAARRSGLPFEASPIGRWVRISGTDGVVYVIQDAWGEGCLLMEIDRAENRQTEHFLSPELAMVAAARAVGYSSSGQAARLAEAG